MKADDEDDADDDVDEYEVDFTEDDLAKDVLDTVCGEEELVVLTSCMSW